MIAHPTDDSGTDQRAVSRRKGESVKALVVGSGGREHALSWKLSQSALVEKLYAVPGNPGISECAECVPIDAGDVEAVTDLAAERKVDLVVVGPEAPLAAGLVDRLKERGVPAFGPVRAAARIESSKAFAKDFMARHGIPTAEYKICSSPEDGLETVEKWELPLVVKADGLAAGKGSVVCRTRDEAREAVRTIMVRRKFGRAGDRIVIERCLSGEETSVLTLVGRGHFVTLPPSQDYKRIFEGDKGPNTGGMGAICPLAMVDEATLKQIEEKIVVPTIEGLASEGIEYEGVLYSGLMLTEEGPHVIEFNCRMGDPETQAVLPSLEGDFGAVVAALALGEKPGEQLRWSGRYFVCTVMATRGYPTSSEKGLRITGIEEAEAKTGVKVFHAGTALDGEGKLVTAGGRVLGVTAGDESLEAARAKTLEAVSMIHFDGAYYRRDIGAKWIKSAGGERLA